MKDRKPTPLTKTAVTRYQRRHGKTPTCYRCEEPLTEGKPVIIAGGNKTGSRYYHTRCWLSSFYESDYEPSYSDREDCD